MQGSRANGYPLSDEGRLTFCPKAAGDGYQEALGGRSQKEAESR